MSSVRYDLHTHTTYSDGSDIREMIEAATDAGLDGIGLTDHCIPYEDSFGRSDRYPFDGTYEDRRVEIDDLRTDDDVEIEVFDGAEVNYDPTREEEIRDLLANAEFDYVIGSVHYTDAYDVAGPRELAKASAATKREAVETYLEWQCRLLESGLFDVLGHLDLPQRSPALRGVMTGEDYQRLADALAAAETVPEINAGRLEREYGLVHPHPDHLEVFRDAGVSFVLGTDSHAPAQVRERVRLLESWLADAPVDVIDLPVNAR